MNDKTNLQRWLDWMQEGHSEQGLLEMLDDDAVLISPVVHTPQKGKPITFAYLKAAGGTIGNDSFRYTNFFDCGNQAVLEFETEMDGIFVNGIDMITWNEAGLITEFKVMIRPLQAVQVVHRMMGEMLAEMKAKKVQMG
ncbi:MAG: nuclear transport factor 2 family protein [Pseudomonadota bacterium]